METGRLFSQDNSTINNLEVSTKIYNEIDGFSIYRASSMVFDNKDWLWISGISLELSNDNKQQRKVLIQRFSGSVFQTISLPEFLPSAPKDINLYKRNDGQFYVLFQNSQYTKLAVVSLFVCISLL